MIFDFTYALSIIPTLARAAIVTLEATFLSFLLALVLGLVLATMRLAPVRVLPETALWFIEFVRGTPLLLQLFFLFLVLPKHGVTMPALFTGILGIGVHYGAYCAEVFRAGIQGVPKGQWEASLALNMSPGATFTKIILPQAIPPIIPALGNYLISMFKETPLLSALAIVELMQTGLLLGSQYFRYIEPITLVGLFFLTFSLLSAAGVRWLEKRLTMG
jgi:polar amino acid transport system permease protein